MKKEGVRRGRRIKDYGREGKLIAHGKKNVIARNEKQLSLRGAQRRGNLTIKD
jgi:hypothetical protein